MTQGVTVLDDHETLHWSRTKQIATLSRTLISNTLNHNHVREKSDTFICPTNQEARIEFHEILVLLREMFSYRETRNFEY